MSSESNGRKPNSIGPKGVGFQSLSILNWNKLVGELDRVQQENLSLLTNNEELSKSLAIAKSKNDQLAKHFTVARGSMEKITSEARAFRDRCLTRAKEENRKYLQLLREHTALKEEVLKSKQEKAVIGNAKSIFQRLSMDLNAGIDDRDNIKKKQDAFLPSRKDVDDHYAKLQVMCMGMKKLSSKWEDKLRKAQEENEEMREKLKKAAQFKEIMNLEVAFLKSNCQCHRNSSISKSLGGSTLPVSHINGTKRRLKTDSSKVSPRRSFLDDFMLKRVTKPGMPDRVVRKSANCDKIRMVLLNADDFEVPVDKRSKLQQIFDEHDLEKDIGIRKNGSL